MRTEFIYFSDGTISQKYIANLITYISSILCQDDQMTVAICTADSFKKTLKNAIKNNDAVCITDDYLTFFEDDEKSILQNNKTDFTEEGRTAGFVSDVKGTAVAVLPREGKMLDDIIAFIVGKYIIKNGKSFYAHSELRVSECSFDDVNSIVLNFYNDGNPRIYTIFGDDSAHIHIFCAEETQRMADETARETHLNIKMILGDNAYSGREFGIAHTVVNKLIKNNIHLATAESCTAGMLSAAITSVPNSSSVFEIGISSYSNRIKSAALGVSQKTMTSFGAVSMQTAAEMAKGIYRLSGSELGLSITGVAGPGKSEAKPKGTVYIALTDGKRVWVIKNQFDPKLSRDEIRNKSVYEALDLVRRYLNFLPKTLPGGSKFDGPINLLYSQPHYLDNIIEYSSSMIREVVAPDDAENVSDIFNGSLPTEDALPFTFFADAEEGNPATEPSLDISNTDDLLFTFEADAEEGNAATEPALDIPDTADSLITVDIDYDPESDTDVLPPDNYEGYSIGTIEDDVTDEKLNIPSSADVLLTDLEGRPEEFDITDYQSEEYSAYEAVDNESEYDDSPLVEGALGYDAKPKLTFKRLAFFGIFAVIILGIIAASAYAVNYFVSKHTNDKIVSEARALWNFSEERNADGTYGAFNSLRAINPDISGWLKIGGTEIDNPVTVGFDNDHYKTHNFHNEKSRYGSIFIDNRCRVDTPRPTQNIVIFGQNMTDDSMFGTLSNVLTLSSIQKNSVIELTTLYNNRSYRIFSVMLIAPPSSDNGATFGYTNYQFDDESEWKNWLDEACERSLYIVDIEHSYADNYITLYTDSDMFRNARLVVVGREIRSDENIEEDVSITANPNPRYPQIWYDLHGSVNPFKDKESEDGTTHENSSVSSEPSEPAPSEPAPSEPEPSEPEPSEPVPSEPEPSEPEPSGPEPSEPEPSEPEPSEPAPSEPESSEPESSTPSESVESEQV